ncbi:MAG TPA: photosystem II protein PsbQ [Prochlorococcaceae cyanobacterium AMR_MDS_5431]|nr:photosystem II protein PsbQ [Prochlorococcaceae cyanobacterium AMR_MDS_5431]
MVFNLRRVPTVYLVLVLCLNLVACDGSGNSQAVSMSDNDIAIISSQAASFRLAEDRLPELAELVANRNWVFTRNLIHGPLQEVGREMLYINQHLLPEDRDQASKIAEGLKSALSELDEAAKLQDGDRLTRAYGKVVDGFVNYGKVIPVQ